MLPVARRWRSRRVTVIAGPASSRHRAQPLHWSSITLTGRRRSKSSDSTQGRVVMITEGSGALISSRSTLKNAGNS